MASVADPVARIYSVLTGQPQNHLLSLLRKDSLFNEELRDNFNSQKDNYDVLTFYETKHTDVMIKKKLRILPQLTSMYIVPRDSAKYGSSKEGLPLPIEANHSEVCKFSSEQDPKYEPVRDNITEMVNKFRLSVSAPDREPKAKGPLLEPSLNLVMNYEPHERVKEPISDGPKLANNDKAAVKKALRKILKPTDHAQDTLDKITKQFLPGTCTWVLQNALYQKWAARSIPILWIGGMPGAGKSFLASRITTYLDEQFAAEKWLNTHTSVAYYFFRDSASETRSIHQALRDLASQISESNPVYAKHLARSCESMNDISSLESAWRKLFVDFFITPKELKNHAFIVLDGIDEANEQERVTLLSLLRDVTVGPDGDVRISVILTSRLHLQDEIVTNTHQSRLPTILVDAVQNSKDISHFVDSGMRKSRVLRSISDELRLEIRRHLVDEANGMFLWVDLMIRELGRKRNITEVRKSLQEAPGGLHSMLRHVLEGLARSESFSPEDADDLNDIFQWTTLVKRPLKLGELDAMLQCRSPTGDGLLLLEQKLRTDWAAFFTLDREDGRSTADLIVLAADERGTVGDLVEVEYLSSKDDFFIGEFASELETTVVSFCHASIGDYFRQDHGKVPVDAPNALGVHMDEAKAQFLKFIFQILVDDDPKYKRLNNHSLGNYAGCYWLSHLRETSLSKVSVADKADLGVLLVRLCRDTQTVENWAGAQSRSFWTEGAVPTVMAWLEDADVRAALSPDDKEWVAQTVKHPATIFEKFVHTIGRHWLEEDWHPVSCFELVHGYIKLIKDDTAISEQPDVSDSAIIQETAEWLQLTRTSLWYSQVGTAMLDSGLLDGAQTQFNLAIDQDELAWAPHAGLAEVFTMRGDVEHARAELRVAANKLRLWSALMSRVSEEEDPGSSELARLLERLGDCDQELGMAEDAYANRSEAWRTDPSRHSAIDACLRYLYIQERWTEIMDILTALNEKKESSDGRSPLVSWIRQKCGDKLGYGVHVDRMVAELEGCRRAAHETGQLPFLIEATKDTIKHCQRTQRPLAQVMATLFLSEIYYYERIDPEQAVRLWTEVTQTGLSAKAHSPLVRARTAARTELARYYLAAAEAHHGTADGHQYVRELEQLTVAEADSGGESHPSQASLALAAWYQQYGQPGKARPYFRAHVKRALDAIRSNAASDDFDPTLFLFQVCAAVGEDDQAVAIYRWSLSGREGTTSAFQRALSRRTAKDDPTDPPTTDSWDDEMPWICDGTCPPAYDLRRRDPLWFCRYCFDTGFCRPCLHKVRSGNLPMNRCDSKHDWFEVQMTNRIVPDGHILVRDTIVALDGWIDAVYDRWGLPHT